MVFYQFRGLPYHKMINLGLGIYFNGFKFGVEEVGKLVLCAVDVYICVPCAVDVA